LKAALPTLVKSYDYARTLDRDVWEFAVEIERLESQGADASDVRWLICNGYAQHGLEVTNGNSAERCFQQLSSLALPPGVGIVLTPHGMTVLGALASTNGTSAQATSQPINHPFAPGALPRWDADCRELRVGDVVVKCFKVPAANQEAILAAFEEEHWPRHVDDPLPPVRNLDSKRRLHDAIIRLNSNQLCRLVHFHGDGTGRGIRWELKVPGHVESSPHRHQRAT
jgi:hypothetical protein